jgi:molybdopterin/thiamine biosynthesis adenylyltransferase
MGGLGSVAAQYLAAAGVGQLVIADFDTLEESNLQRQVLYRESNLGQLKVEAAREQLLSLNSDLQVRTVSRRLEGQQLQMEAQLADVVLDCSDNIATRYAVNTACKQTNTPLISGAAVAFDGQLMMFDFRSTSACYQCLFPNAVEQQLNCATAGILGPVVGTMATLQALETLKFLAQMSSPQWGRVSHFDGRNLEWMHVKIRSNPGCPCCAS